MQTKRLLPLLLLSLIGAGSPSPAMKSVAGVTGDYVEARTASVFAGPCHYNGELVTEGRQAILAWSITSGSWNGINLSGVRAMASVVCEDNLSDEKAVRKSELVIDTSASDAQVASLCDMIRLKAGAQLGQIAATRRAAISFAHSAGSGTADGYIIKADGFASMTVHPMPNNECCSQPHLVWYNPLSPIVHRKVGFTETAAYNAGTNGDQWERASENSAFYGQFELADRKDRTEIP